MDLDFVDPLVGYEPTIGRWLWAMQDTRQRTLDSFEGLTDEIVNWVPPKATNSIGSLLYHIAAIEMSWLYEDILEGTSLPPDISRLMQYDVRDDDGSLTAVIIESLDSHLQRLEFCRKNFLSKFKDMSIDEFRRPRKFEEYEVTPEWIIHHLMQHEAEHRGQIGEIRVMAERALRKSSME